MAQPLLGIVASALVVAISLAYLSLFSFATFAGPVAFVMLCLIPLQVVIVVIRGGNLAIAQRLKQPAKGLVMLLPNIIGAVAISFVVLRLVGEGVTPPGPIPSHYAVIVVPTTFFLAIMFGGWPFSLTKSSRMTGVLVLFAAYVLTYAIFRIFFNYDFMQGAPVYLASAPHGAYNAVMALVFYVTALAGMFLMLHFDLWPLTKSPSVMQQPVLGIVWTIVAFAVAAAVMWVTTGALAMDPLYVLTRVTAPFIFGTIIVLNMLQNSLFASLKQPLKGIANAVAASLIGALLAQLYGLAAPAVVGPLTSGPPGYDYEIWLVNALLSVTFPFLIFYAVYFGYWPLVRQPATETVETART